MMKRFCCLFLALMAILACGAVLAEGELPLEAIAEDRPQYLIALSLDTQENRLHETVTVSFCNNSGEILKDIWLRDYVPEVQEHAQPGAYASSVLAVTDAKSGAELAFEADRQRGLIIVTPLKPLEPGEAMSIELEYEADIPIATNERFQVSGFKKSNGVTYKLCQFYPVLCMRRDGEWVYHPYEFNGEAFFSECANYQVTLSLPSEFTVVATGREVPFHGASDGQTLWSIGATDVRDMVILASTEYFEPFTGKVGDVTVNSYYATSEQRKQAELSLQAAMNSVELFEEKFGPYPYDELDVCITQMMQFAAGIEYPGLVEIWQIPEVTRSHVRTIVSHEVAHQWFYGIVGNDQYDEAFLDEAFAFYAQAVYMRYIDGKSKGEIADIVKTNKADKPVLPVDLSLDEYKALAGDGYLDSYTLAVYRSGRAFLWEVQNVMGDDAFFEMIRRWVAAQTFKTPTIDQFIEHLYQCTGRNEKIVALVEKYMQRGVGAAN